MKNTNTMRNYNTEVPYNENCPARTDPKQGKRHCWSTVKGSKRKHATKGGFVQHEQRCKHCEEVTTGEYTFLFSL